MSKAKQLRDQQEEINSLNFKLKQANEKIAVYEKKSRMQLGSFVKKVVE